MDSPGQGREKVSKQLVEADKLRVIWDDRGGNALVAINQRSRAIFPAKG
jgi:hypothetical protein